MRHLRSAWFGIVICAGLGIASHTPATVSLEGVWKALAGDLAPANAYLPGLDEKDWGTLVVPGNWHLQGKAYSGVVWYRRHFRGIELAPDRLVRLRFDGVDYAADIWINGHYVGHHEGYFEPFSFYVQSYLVPNSDNVLVVRVNSPNETPEAWSLHKRLIKGVLNHHDTRPGGAWSVRGQEQNTGGIWGAVTLSAPSRVDISRIQVTSRPESSSQLEPLRHDHADTVWLVGIDTWFAHVASSQLRLEAQIEPETFTPTGTSELSVAVTRVDITSGEVAHLEARVVNPRLWWTWDQGEPNLYRVTVKAFEGAQFLAESSVLFGFRTIEVDPSTKRWRLNGRSVFLRGTNYISSQWLSEMTKAKLGADLDLMKHANINAVRVHAHLEGEAFYSQCDEKGVLVWQDFALQWGYDDGPEFVQEASRQALAMVHWLYNHPSIGVWTLQNEPPFDADWMKWKYRDYQPEQNKLLNAELVRVVSKADSTRWVHAYSTTGEHQWLGWYSGSWMDFAKPSKEAIISEYGAQALPNLTSLRRIFAESELWPKTDAEWEKWEYHNFQRHETFELAGVKQGANTEEWIGNTQRYQGKLIQFAAENYRRQKYSPVTAVFQFLFNEDWPSINWGIVDYWRSPKPGYEALRTAYQPVLPSIAWSQDRWAPGQTPSFGLWIVNDLARDYPHAELSWTLRDARRVLQENSQRVDIRSDSSSRIQDVKFPDLRKGQYVLILVLCDAGGAALGENSFAFTVDGAASVSELEK
jgi:beta-mannosidase